MLITLNISSRLDGLMTSYPNEFINLSFDDSQSIKQVIKRYCEVKAIDLNPIFCITNEENKTFSRNKTIASLPIRNNEKLYLGVQDPFSTLRFGNWFSIATLALFIGIGGIVICTCVYILLKTKPDSYAIVFDAGSTHTEALLYRWPNSKINNTGIVSQIHTCYIQDGIANVLLSGNQSVSDYMDKCFDEGVQQVPPESEPSPVYFGGTAGLRLLREVNESAASATMNKVVHYLSSSDLKFDKSQAEILSGKKEGVCGWITVNYLNHRIRSGQETWGALDMGGASTQISFEMPSNTSSTSFKYNSIDDKDDNRGIVPVNLYGHSFSVFTQSFLCYGVSQAKARYRAAVVLKQLQVTNNSPTNTNIILQSPCEAIGKISNYTFNSVFNTSCTNSYLQRATNNNEKSMNFVFQGSSNAEQCQNLIKYILSSEFCTDMKITDEKCLNTNSIPGNYQKRSFQAFSGYGYIYSQLKLNASSTTTKAIFKSTASQRCNHTYAELFDEALANPSMKIQVLDELCFKSLYVFTLLSEVYKFETEEDWSNIEFRIEVSGISLGWAIGYMVNATESISSIPPIPSISILTFSLLTILFIIFTIVGLAFAYHALQMRRFLHYYQKITLSP